MPYIETTYREAREIPSLAPWPARKKYFVLASKQTFYCALDLIAATGSLIGMGVTGDREVITFTLRQFEAGKKIFSYLFADLLRALNPQAPFAYDPQQGNVEEQEQIWSRQFPLQWIYEQAHPFLKEYEAQQNIRALRTIYVALTVSALVIRTLEAVIGIGSRLPLAFFSYGRWETVNSLAFYTLQAAPNLFFDCAGGIIKICNPDASHV